MSCFDVPDGLVRCVTLARPWVELVIGLTGLGTLALVAFLHRIAKKLSEANDTVTKAFNEAVTDKQRAEAKLSDVNREFGAVQYQLQVCQSMRTGDVGELGKKLETALTENQSLQAKDDIIKMMRNWQREGELSDASHAAQSKVGV